MICAKNEMESRWTLDSLHEHFEELLRFFEARMTERFETQFRANDALTKLIMDSRSDASEWQGAIRDMRGIYLGREEWSAAHQQVFERHAADVRMLEVRMDGMDSERNKIKTDVTRLESRVGYLPVGLVVAGISLLIGILTAVGQLLHVYH